METKRESIQRELSVIADGINMAYYTHMTFEELISNLAEELGIAIYTVRLRISELGYEWKELKEDINENSIIQYYRELDTYFKPFPETFAEDVYELLGKNTTTQKYCKSRNILSKQYRYTISDDNGNIKYVKKSRHPLYRIWSTKKTITGNSHGGYICEHHKKAYLDKGVKMYQPWVDDFDLFYDYMMNIGWYKGSHISRHNDIGDYVPGNVSILSASENTGAAQQRYHIKLVYKDTGKEYYFNSLCEASKELNLNVGSLSHKLKGSNVYSQYEIELIQ